MTSKADFALPPHIQWAVDKGVDPFEIIQGEILNKILDLESPCVIDSTYEFSEMEEAMLNILTDLRVLGYNISFAIADREKLNGR